MVKVNDAKLRNNSRLKTQICLRFHKTSRKCGYNQKMGKY
jgi:hypothetical protein